MHGKKLRIRIKLRASFFNTEEKLITDFIKATQKLYPDLKVKYDEKRGRVDIRSQRFVKNMLKLGKVGTYDWEVPKFMNNKQKGIWIKAFSDCDGTVYYKNYSRYIAIDSMNLMGLEKISGLLNDFEIKNSIYPVKYKSIVSYRLKIYRKENLIKFRKLIGFNHPVKRKKLSEAIKSYRR